MVTEFKNIPELGGIQIEVTGSGGSPNVNSGELFRAIQSMANAMAMQINQIPEQSRPAEINISFGVKLLSSGKCAISLSDTSVNFNVSMKWSGESSGLFNGYLPSSV